MEKILNEIKIVLKEVDGGIQANIECLKPLNVQEGLQSLGVLAQLFGKHIGVDTIRVLHETEHAIFLNYDREMQKTENEVLN